MDTKTELGLNYNRIESYDAFIEHSPHIRRLVKIYREKANDAYSVDQIMDLMQVVVGSRGFYMLLVSKDGHGVGLLTAHGMKYEDTKDGAMIHIGVTDDVSLPESGQIVKTALEDLGMWAKDNNYTATFARTERQEGPFDRLMKKNGWDRLMTIYTKEV